MFKALIVHIIILALHFTSLVDCKTDRQFCDCNYVDSVLNYGYKYRITQNSFIGDYNEDTDTIDNFHQLDQTTDSDRQMHYQSAYGLTKFECSGHNTGCLTFRNRNFSMVFYAYDSLTGKQYKNIFSGTDSDLDTITLKNITDKYNETIRNSYDKYNAKTYTEYQSQSGQTHKPSAFWPKRDLFVFVFNANRHSMRFNETMNAKLVTKKKGYKWQYNDIADSKDKVYTALFWWKSDDCVYAVIENRNEYRRNGYIYKFNTNNVNNPFIATNIKVKDVRDFFGCTSDSYITPTEDDSRVIAIEGRTKGNEENTKSTVSLLFIAIALIAVLLIVLLVMFLYFRFTKKPSDKSKSFNYSRYMKSEKKDKRKTRKKQKTENYKKLTKSGLKRWKKAEAKLCASPNKSRKLSDKSKQSGVQTVVSTGFDKSSRK